MINGLLLVSNQVMTAEQTLMMFQGKAMGILEISDLDFDQNITASISGGANASTGVFAGVGFAVAGAGADAKGTAALTSTRTSTVVRAKNGAAGSGAGAGAGAGSTDGKKLYVAPLAVGFAVNFTV
jgi:hypothetical protein